MGVVSRKNLLEVGAHFGHKKDKMNPKMKRFVYGARGGVNIIDLEKTVQSLNRAYEAMQSIVADGGRILFVGTKKQASEAVKSNAEKCGEFYINHRWLGGTLTNFKTIKKSIDKLKEMESETDTDITKKEAAVRDRKKEKLTRNLSGVKEMHRLPDAIFVCDVNQDGIAVSEAQVLGIPVFGIVDTDGNPEGITYPIPANDDAVRSVALILSLMSKAVLAGKGEEQTEREEATTEEIKAEEVKAEEAKTEESVDGEK